MEITDCQVSVELPDVLHAGRTEAKREQHGLLAIAASRPDGMLDAATMS